MFGYDKGVISTENYSAYTKDKSLLFLHGYLCSGEIFINQKKFFSKYFDCYFPDLKGFGSNLYMEYPYSLGDYCNEVKEYCYKQGIEKPHLVAHSFGGRIALKIASENCDYFDRIVITGGAGLKAKRGVKYRLKNLAFRVAKRFLPKEKLKGFYSKDYNSLSPVMQESFKLIVKETLDGRLTKIQNQTLLIYGKGDRETPIYMAKTMEREMPNATLSVYDKAGHFCFIDCPQKFNLEVREFLLSR